MFESRKNDLQKVVPAKISSRTFWLLLRTPSKYELGISRETEIFDVMLERQQQKELIKGFSTDNTHSYSFV